MASKLKTQSDREQLLRESYRYQRSLYFEMMGFRDEWLRRAIKAEAELEALQETLRRLGEVAASDAGRGEEPVRPWWPATDWDERTSVIAKLVDSAQNKGRRPRNKACQSDTSRPRGAG